MNIRILPLLAIVVIAVGCGKSGAGGSSDLGLSDGQSQTVQFRGRGAEVVNEIGCSDGGTAGPHNSKALNCYHQGDKYISWAYRMKKQEFVDQFAASEGGPDAVWTVITGDRWLVMSGDTRVTQIAVKHGGNIVASGMHGAIA